MDIYGHPPQWICPYCLEVLPSRDGIMKHLEPNQHLITDLLRQLRQALTVPDCQQRQNTSEDGNNSCKDTDDEPESMKSPLASQPLRCPHCRGKPYSKKYHLIRHFKSHVACNVECECGQKYDNVEQFEKHLAGCRKMQTESKGTVSADKERLRILNLKKKLNSTTKKYLNEQLERDRSSKRLEFPSSRGTRLKIREQNQTRPYTRHSRGGIKRQCSDNYLNTLEQRSPKGGDSNTAALMANKSKGSRAFEDSESAFCDRESIDDISLGEEATSISPPDTVARSRPCEVSTEQSHFTDTGLPFAQATNTRFQAGPMFGSKELDFDISMLMQPVQAFGNSVSELMQPTETFPELDISMMMQPARPFGELDISMQMRHEQTFAAMPTQMMQQQTCQYDDLDISMMMRPADSYSSMMEPQVNARTR